MCATHRITLALVAGMLLGACGQVSGDGAPACEITAPGDGTLVFVHDAVTFGVQASDGETSDNRLTFAWASSLGDTLPTGLLDDDGGHGFTTTDLSEGRHTVEVRVTDRQGDACLDSVELVVQRGEAPIAAIEVPLADGFYYADRPLTLRARATDAEDAPEALRLHWALVGGEGLAEGIVPDAQGGSEIERSLEIGTHEIEVRVIDTHGNSGTDRVSVTVGGPNQPPECSITAPLDGDSVPWGSNLAIRGEATDPNVPPPMLTTLVSSDIDGSLGDPTPDGDGDVELTVPTLTAGFHALTLEVRDELGRTCEDTITLRVDEPPAAEITAPTLGTVPSNNLRLLLQGTATDTEDALETLAVQWFSDVDGLLADRPPDAAGVLDDETAALTAGDHTLTLEVTDSLGSTATDSVTLRVNSAPTAPLVSLQPAMPTTVHDLQSSIDTPATDADGDPITYVVTWLVDSVPSPAHDGLVTIPAAATARSQVWTVEVRAHDGLTLGPPGSAFVTVDNTPAQGGSATVSPSLGTPSSTFSLTTDGWADVDGDPEDYLYQWVVNGSPVVGANASTFLPGAAANAGDPLHCELTPWDGTDVGVMFLSGPAFINQPAAVASVAISPTLAYETSTLTSTLGSLVDPEGAGTTLLYQWYLGASSPIAIAGATGPSLTGADFDHFDEVVLGVSVDDGTEIGPEVFSNAVTILNTIPATTAPSLSPSLLYTATQATCVPAPLVDPDPDVVTPGFSWTVDGQPVLDPTSGTLVTSAVLDGAVHFDKGATVRCSVVPDDTYDLGTPAFSPAVGVLNTPPTAPGVVVTPAVPGDDDPLSCIDLVPSYDADGDVVNYQRSWTLGGGGTPYTSQVLLPSVTSVGDTWGCSLTPWDGSVVGPAGSDSVTLMPSQILDPGAAGTTYSQQAHTRGMWFEAPANFTITGLFVPDDSNSADFQNVQVVLLPAGFTAGGSTTTATTLFYGPQEGSAGFVSVNIPVLAGEQIGVLGARGTSTMHSMYSSTSAPVSAALDGAPVLLHRLEYQDNLWSLPAGTLTDATGPIGRVEIEYIP